MKKIFFYLLLGVCFLSGCGEINNSNTKATPTPPIFTPTPTPEIPDENILPDNPIYDENITSIPTETPIPTPTPIISEDREVVLKNLINIYIDEIFSYKEIKSQLISDGYSELEISYVIDNMNIDWNVVLNKQIDYYLENFSLSYDSLVNKLIDDGYFEEQVITCIQNKNINWKEQAKKIIESILPDFEGISKNDIMFYLIEEGYSIEDFEYVIKNVSIDWEEQSLLKINSLKEEFNYSIDELRQFLIDEYYFDEITINNVLDKITQ